MAHAHGTGKMTHYVCFLRGINVGGHRKIPMADLRRLCVGITSDPDVRSYIASGNVLMASQHDKATLIAKLQEAIKTTFGFDVPVLLLTGDEVRTLLASCPAPDTQGNLVHAYLCYDAPQLDTAGVDALRTATEVVTVTGSTVWLYAPDGIGRSKLAAKMERLIGVEATARNLNTIRKVVEMVST